MESEEQMRARRAIGYQAWWENQPVRVPRAKSWSDLNITRTVDWGALARFWVLDTRQYRSDQACNDGEQNVPCGEWADPSRTLLGERQERWLTSGLSSSNARWRVLANQVMVAPYDTVGGGPQRVSMDKWSGYPAARARLLDSIAQSAPNQTVVLTGDIHTNWVNELRTDFRRAERPAIGAEFVGTSISSGGDGNDETVLSTAEMRADNPHIKWQQNRRGYMKCTVDGAAWTTEFRTVPFVTKPDAPVDTSSRWRVTRGKAGIERL
jgi:alkaline phosphatase D